MSTVRPFRGLCPEADLRDAMTDDEFWAHIYPSERPEPDIEDPNEPELVSDLPVTPCEVCGATETSCGYDETGRPWVHCDDPEVNA